MSDLSPTPTTAKGFYWICTQHNITPEIRSLLKSPPPYIVEMWYQDEIGEQTGALHLQIAMRTLEVRKSAILKDFPTMWIQKAINKMACINYCSKVDDPTAVKGTFVHFTRPTNEIIEASLPLRQEEIMEIIAHWVHEDDLASEADVQYHHALNDIITVRPELLTALASSRIQPIWRIVNTTFLRKADNFRNTCHEEPDSQTERDDIIEIYPECDCCKDECLNCAYWEQYIKA